MNVRQLVALAATTAAVSVGAAIAAPTAQATCFKLGGFVEICDSEDREPVEREDVIQARTTYVVREINPFTGGVEWNATYTDYNEAERAYNDLTRVHWAEWRYAGIGEQMNRRRFASSSEAQAFLSSNPCPNPVFCVIDHKRVVATQVQFYER